jgi:iron uptake system component EfeO
MARPLPDTVAGLAAALVLGIFAAGCGHVDHDPSPASTVSAAPTVVAQPALTTAAAGYHDYVVAEVAALQTTTRSFTDAVRTGDIAKAKALYGPARTHYETIESVVESLGEFDDFIDPRIDDAADPAKWIGFHRIEKALWADSSLAGMAPFANELDLDIFALKARAAHVSFEPVDLATRAGDLLASVSTTKITGEEERYSHTDLWDIAANIAGARAAFELLKPALDAGNPGLVNQIEVRFADVTTWLDRYRQGPGYVDWSAVPPPELRTLSDAVDALAEPLSQVGATLPRATP